MSWLAEVASVSCAPAALTAANDSARATGYFGTGQNFVNDSGRQTDTAFTAEMRRGSELFARPCHPYTRGLLIISTILLTVAGVVMVLVFYGG